MRKQLQITSLFLGCYAGIVGMQHGMLELLQGSGKPESLLFHAIGTPCQLETVWHAWLPVRWLLGGVLPGAMLAAGGVLYIVFDLGLPVLAVLSAYAGKVPGDDEEEKR